MTETQNENKLNLQFSFTEKKFKYKFCFYFNTDIKESYKRNWRATLDQTNVSYATFQKI